ncbi:aminopeptidase P family protein [Pedobacter rhizosphaerae]|uniref:Xaa-Pro aminopeptidase n=1 Tax=Pedobacter rhizosphaerae TaxID=390241 RepID=A0A1H9MRQ1_9SPHI|nr:aminopeptidase P family protein [Pedobacter rhizosphaerae]SER26400.1 Xaa-Pro aminopeptidase [Pedobacter rhizosphaerae]
MFHTNVYVERRAELARKLKTGVLLFLGNEESPMNYADNTYSFRQDSTFLYYFGIAQPGLSAIIDLDENQEIIFGNEMGIDDIVWMGRQQTLQDKAHLVGIQKVNPVHQLSSYLSAAQLKKRSIHFLPPYRAENKIKLAQLLNMEVGHLKQAVSTPFIKAVIAQRAVKSATEIAEIAQAVNNSIDMHLLAMRKTKPGMKEEEIAALIHGEALRTGGNIAYPIILTIHGEILHNHFHGNVMQEGQMVLNDSGMETALGYCGDLTRTFPVGKKFDSRQKEVYSIVQSALENAEAVLAPGKRFIDVHYEACKTLAEGMKAMGLMKGNMDEAVAAGAHALFFQCGTGHMMGLDVHDMEDLGEEYVGYSDTLKKETSLFGLKSLRLGRELEPGFVFTIEPGIYMIPELIDLWRSERRFESFINYAEVEKFKDFSGIRLENNYAMTQDSYQLLGKPLAINIEDVEEIRNSAY